MPNEYWFLVAFLIYVIYVLIKGERNRKQTLEIENKRKLMQEEEERKRQLELERERMEKEEKERIRILNLRAELRQLLQEMPILIDITGIEFDTLYDDWGCTVAEPTHKLCCDFQLEDLIDRLVPFWDYKEARGFGFSQLSEMTSADRILTFAVTYSSTIERFLEHKIYILRGGPEQFKAMLVQHGSSNRNYCHDILDDNHIHPKFTYKCADGSLN